MADARPSPRDPVSRLAILSLVPLAIFALALAALVSGAHPIELSLPWVRALGVDASFVFDGLSLFFVLLISGVGACVFVYAAGYLGNDPRRRRLFAWLAVFMAAMLGAVGAEDLILLYVFWELTSLSSFMLVSFHHESAPVRRAARQAMLVTFGGGFMMLMGIVLLSELTGTTSLRELLASRDRLSGEPLAALAMVCIFVGAFTKSAQFPFHFWLPNAMAAPTPVSAYLHSATMVKLGIYLLARLEPLFEGEAFFGPSLIVVGGLTSAWGMFQTVRERDFKRILAWSTVSALGTMVMLIGLPGPESTMALIAFMLAHALYKAPLFFVAGNLDHSMGTRDIGHLASLTPAMPWTAATALFAAISMGGLPLSLGFFAKDLIHIAKAGGGLSRFIGYGSVPVSAISFAVGAIAAVRIFWHKGGAKVPASIHEVGLSMRVPAIVLAAAGVLLGLFPALAVPLIVEAAHSVLPADAVGSAIEAQSRQSLFALIPVYGLGVVVYVFWDWIHVLTGRLRLPAALHASALFDRTQRTLSELAGAMTRTLSNGKLSSYAAVTFGTIAAASLSAAGLAIAAGGELGLEPLALDPATLAIVVAVALLVAAAMLLTVIVDAFLLLLVSGVMGIGLSLVFLFSGAPDLAFTQFLVEVALVVVIASVLLRVRILGLEHPPRRAGALRVGLSILSGVGVGLALLLAHGAGTQSGELAAYFSENALPLAHGRNVVNVILVDFRAGDTLGEITVLFVTFLATARIFTAFSAAHRGAP